MSDPWEVKATSNVETEIPPAGMLPAALVAMIAEGTQKNDLYGTLSSKIFLVWELVTHKMTGMKDVNHVIGQDYTLTFGPKSNLRCLVEKWRGKEFAENEPFKLDKLLGQKCILTIVHKTKNDKLFAKIEGISPAKGWPNPIPDPQRKPFVWKLGMGDPPSQEWLPRIYGELVSDVIKRCQELNGGAQGGNGAAPAPSPTGPSAPPQHSNTSAAAYGISPNLVGDEIPF